MQQMTKVLMYGSIHNLKQESRKNAEEKKGKRQREKN